MEDLTTQHAGDAIDASMAQTPSVVTPSSAPAPMQVEVMPALTTAGQVFGAYQGLQFREIMPYWLREGPHDAAWFQQQLQETCKARRVDWDATPRGLGLVLERGIAPNFFPELLDFIIAEAAQTSERLKDHPVQLLRAHEASPDNEVRVTSMTTATACSLLAAMFLNLVSEPDLWDEYPPVEEHCTFPFTNMMAMVCSDCQSEAAKLECLLRYFERQRRRVAQGAAKAALSQDCEDVKMEMDEDDAEDAVDPAMGHLYFYRLQHRAVVEADMEVPLSSMTVQQSGSIEDVPHAAYVDFANRYICGGAFSGGNVQEEIMCFLRPELLVAGTVFERMEAHEAIVVCGTERFCTYTGYGASFSCTGDYEDDTAVDTSDGTRLTTIIAVDALPVTDDPSSQWTREAMLRELRKAVAGFQLLPQERFNKPRIATGNWGCGEFGGDPQLKFMLQWMAASLTKRDLVYCTFGIDALKKADAVVDKLVTEKFSVARIWERLGAFVSSSLNTSPHALFEFLLGAGGDE